MARFSFVLTFIACIGMSVGIVFAQGEVADGGTVRGQIVDTSDKQNPIEGVEVKIVGVDGTEFIATTDANGDYVRAGIPAGRYLISIYKDGYGDRIGKPVTVVNGGDHFVPLKMTKKSGGVAGFLQRFGVGQQDTFKDIHKDIPENMAENPNEHWYNITLMNNKIGYMHTSSDKTEYEGEEVDRTKIDIVMNLKALGTSVTIEITRVEYTGADLMPRYFLSTANESSLKQVEGRIVDGTAYIKTTLNGETTVLEVAVPPDTISEHTGVESLFRKGLKIGEKRNFHIFSFDLLKPVKTEIEVEGRDTLTYQSAEKQVYVLRQTMDMMNGITAKVWLDADGVSYRTEVPMMGFTMITAKTDKKTALRGTEEIDVVLKTRILPSGGHPMRNAKNFEADVKLTSGSLADTIMSNSRQKLEVGGKNVGRLSIQVPTVVAEDCPDLPLQRVESEFLGASAYIQTDAPGRFVRKCRKYWMERLIRGVRQKKLCRWVHTAL